MPCLEAVEMRSDTGLFRADCNSAEASLVLNPSRPCCKRPKSSFIRGVRPSSISCHGGPRFCRSSAELRASLQLRQAWQRKMVRDCRITKAVSRTVPDQEIWPGHFMTGSCRAPPLFRNWSARASRSTQRLLVLKNLKKKGELLVRGG